MGYGGINQGLKSHEELKEQQAKLIELQTCMRVLELDFIQLAPRPIRQPVGPGYLPSLQADQANQPVAQLTRMGWSNPTGLQRTGLQRVAYYFDNGTLRREYWTVLDATQTSTTIKRDLMTHLKSVSLRFMDANKAWQTQWPPSSGVAAANQALGTLGVLRSRPIAVEITLETEDWGKLVRVVEMPG
jgi:general secretion pathway protein J